MTEIGPLYRANFAHVFLVQLNTLFAERNGLSVSLLVSSRVKIP